MCSYLLRAHARCVACTQTMDALAMRNSHPRDDCITFDEGPHIYTVNGDSGFTSVTTWLHSHFEKFDAEAVAKRIVERGTLPDSKYHGMTVKEITKTWKLNGQEASAAGTKLHENIERFYNGVEVPPEDRALPDYQLFERFVDNFPVGAVPYRTEWMVWDDALRLAGSIDMVFANDDGTLSIYDWKRCKDIKKHAFRGKSSTTKCIEHIPDSNFWHYSLQLNAYAWLLERHYGKVVRDLQLVVLHPRQHHPIVLKVPWLRQETNDLMTERASMVA